MRRFVSSSFASLASIAVILSVVMASGCVNLFEQQTKIQSDTLQVKIDAPAEVYQGQRFAVYLDVSNPGNLSYESVSLDFFNTGAFSNVTPCSLLGKTIGPNGMQTLECYLKYSRQLERDVQERVDADVTYDKKLDAVINFPIISQKEYEKQRDLKTFQSLSNTFSLHNNELQVDAELTENPIINLGSDKYLYITLRNIGGGFINDIRGEDIKISTVPNGIISRGDCTIPTELFQDSGTFTKISCKLYRYGLDNDYTNVYVFLEVNYGYELRTSASIMVKR
jgi:hypothetical protein